MDRCLQVFYLFKNKLWINFYAYLNIEIANYPSTESILIAIPALVSAYFLATYTARAIGNTVLANVTSGVAKQASKAAQASNLGGGAEVDGFSKTLSSLDISIQTSDFIIVFVLSLVLVVLVIALASSNLLRKQPKELLLDSE